MYILRILGPAELTGRDGARVQSVLKQPKRLALLAYLATAPSGTRTRSEVLDLFWSDRSAEEGRHALSQALYYLRRSLGKSALMVEGERLALNPDLIETDVGRFRTCFEEERFEDAVAHCRGDLLHRFPSVPGFDQWLEGAREALRRQVLEALERLSLDAEATGDSDLAVQWAERGHALAPYHEAPMRRLLSSLIAASEPVRARETFEGFAAKLREELDMEPSPKTEAILSTPVPAVEAKVRVMPDAGTAGAVVTETEPQASLTDAPVQRRNPAFRRWALSGSLSAAIFGVFFFGAFGHVVFSDAGGQVVAEGSESRIGVFPFVYRGHSELAYLGDGIPELISISIQSLDQVSTLNPRALAAGPRGTGAAGPATSEATARAREFGAQQFVIGSVVEAGGQIHVTARLHRTDGDLVATVSERAASEEGLFELVDDLVRQLVASKAFPGGSDLERAAALTTGSLPALRDFLRGERLFRMGSFQEAVGAFDSAVREDSAFALALYRSAIASLWSDNADFDAARTKAGRALMHRHRVSPLEGDLFLALHEFLRGRLLQAERLYESVLLRQPENVEAWFQLAETRFHYGGLHGRGIAGSAEAWEQVLALHPAHHAALIHLSALAALRNDPSLDSLETQVNEPGDAAPTTPQVRALMVFSSGSDRDRTQFLDELRRYSAEAVSSTAAYASRYLRDPEAGARIARIMTDAARPTAERAEGHLLLAHFELAQGRPARARRELETAQGLDSVQAEPHRLLLGTLPRVPVELRTSPGKTFDAGLRLDVHGDVGQPVVLDGSVDSGLRVYGRALAYDRGGGEDGALIAAARRLSDGAEESADRALFQALARGLAAERHLSQGDSAAARSDLSASVTEVERWYEHLRASFLRSLARERFLLAEAELAAGQDQAAESLLSPFGDNSVAELPYLGASLIRIGEIRERGGDAGGAADAYRRALDLWSGAETTLDLLRTELEARARALSSGS